MHMFQLFQIPVMRRNSQVTLEEGSYFCEDAGKCTHYIYYNFGLKYLDFDQLS